MKLKNYELEIFVHWLSPLSQIPYTFHPCSPVDDNISKFLHLEVSFAYYDSHALYLIFFIARRCSFLFSLLLSLCLEIFFYRAALCTFIFPLPFSPVWWKHIPCTYIMRRILGFFFFSNIIERRRASFTGTISAD